MKMAFKNAHLASDFIFYPPPPSIGKTMTLILRRLRVY